MLNFEFAERLVSYRLLDPTLGLLTSPLESWLDSDLLVIEVPLLEFGKWVVHLALQRLLLRQLLPLLFLQMLLLLLLPPKRLQ